MSDLFPLARFSVDVCGGSVLFLFVGHVISCSLICFIVDVSVD